MHRYHVLLGVFRVIETKIRQTHTIQDLLKVPMWARSSGWLADWCQLAFVQEQSLAHYLRISRRCGRLHVELSAKYYFSDYETQIRHHRGFIGSELL